MPLVVVAGSGEVVVAGAVEVASGAVTAGIETDGISKNDRYRYTHFRAPDGRLYELVEERPS